MLVVKNTHPMICAVSQGDDIAVLQLCSSVRNVCLSHRNIPVLCNIACST